MLGNNSKGVSFEELRGERRIYTRVEFYAADFLIAAAMQPVATTPHRCLNDCLRTNIWLEWPQLSRPTDLHDIKTGPLKSSMTGLDTGERELRRLRMKVLQGVRGIYLLSVFYIGLT